MPPKYKAVEEAGKLADKQVEILRQAMASKRDCACPHGQMRCSENNCPRALWTHAQQRAHLLRHPNILQLDFPVDLGDGDYVHAPAGQKQ